MINFDSLLNKKGEVDTKKLKKLIKQKPLMPLVSEEKIRRFCVKANRKRYNEFPDKLPTQNMLSFPIDEHEHIGQYETRHNLYLTIANAYNKVVGEIEDLKERLHRLENSI